MATYTGAMQCEDFLEFQETLKKLRVMDDKIIYALNTSIPTESFKTRVNAPSMCKDLYGQLKSSHEQRETAIKTCINVVSDRVQRLKDQHDVGSGDMDLIRQISKEQKKLRLLQSELNVEEIVKNRSLKVYYERCRTFYKPETLQG